jgi:hypothetical protein
MDQEQDDKRRLSALIRRVVYMIIAIVAITLTPKEPVFTFGKDKGQIYTRSFSMDLKEFVVTQTTLDTHVDFVKEKESVIGLYVCYILMLVLSIACLLAFYPTQLRIYLSQFTMGAGGLFYVFWIYYDVKISGEYATLWPTWTSFMPAVAIAMMVAVYRNVMKHGHYFDDIEDV